jgi:hypothetical protein
MNCELPIKPGFESGFFIFFSEELGKAILKKRAKKEKG